MKATELMIGDWVIPRIWDADSEPSKIVGIHYNSYRGKDYVDWVDCEVWDELDMNDIKPIPLTAEILNKNGFKHYVSEEDSDSFEYSEGNLSYCFNRTTNGYMSCIDVDNSFTITGLIKYVHELQNVLRLCGLSEMADNFEI